MAASHFLSLCQSFRALLALASDDFDVITSELDDLVALQDPSLTSKRTSLLDVKITVQATECWQRQVRGANLERCRVCRGGSLLFAAA